MSTQTEEIARRHDPASGLPPDHDFRPAIRRSGSVYSVQGGCSRRFTRLEAGLLYALLAVLFIAFAIGADQWNRSRSNDAQRAVARLQRSR